MIEELIDDWKVEHLVDMNGGTGSNNGGSGNDPDIVGFPDMELSIWMLTDLRGYGGNRIG